MPEQPGYDYTNPELSTVAADGFRVVRVTLDGPEKTMLVRTQEIVGEDDDDPQRTPKVHNYQIVNVEGGQQNWDLIKNATPVQLGIPDGSSFKLFIHRLALRVVDRVAPLPPGKPSDPE